MRMHGKGLLVSYVLCTGIAVVALALTACGGGGSGGGSSSSGGGSPPPPPPPPPTSGNRSPVLVKQPADQGGVVGHAFNLDVSQGGTAVTDPDGDRLTYQVRATFGALPSGLSTSDPVISGIPTESGTWEIEAQVDDNHGGNSVFLRFYLRIAANSAPVVAKGNTPQLVQAGAHIDYDAAQKGTTFRDPDGDAMTYAISFRGDPQGLVISGTRVSGTLERVGAVEITITASDAFGGAGSDSFLIALPAAEPSALPVLPATSYVYRDEDLPLPYLFRLSSEIRIPLWDNQPADNRTSNAGATLGRVLFYDKRLSITNTMACASCHEQSHGFATPQRFNTGVLGIALKRNAMALANARYSIHGAWFSDMRVRDDLRNLIFVPIDNHDELGMSLYSVESKLKDVSFYPPLFAAACGTPEITRERIAAALAQFVQSLIAYRSKSDLAENSMNNESIDITTVYSEPELRGREIFRGHCGHCHELQAATNVWQANNGLDEIPTDVGIQDPALQQGGTLGVFRAASLRNIAVSGPYMHDGRFGTLREVIEHYDHGVKDGPYLDHLLREQLYGPPIRLNLSEQDKSALEAFLRTMTDDAFLADPKFSDPFAP